MDNLEIELWLSGIDAVLGKRCTEVIHGQSRPRFVLGGCQELIHGSRADKDKPWHLQGLKQSPEPARSLHLCVYEHAGMHRMQCQRQIFEQQGKEGVSFTKRGHEYTYRGQRRNSLTCGRLHIRTQPSGDNNR